MSVHVVLGDGHAEVAAAVSRRFPAPAEIVHVDAHADAQPTLRAQHDGNWLAWWVRRRATREVTWVCPELVLWPEPGVQAELRHHWHDELHVTGPTTGIASGGCRVRLLGPAAPRCLDASDRTWLDIDLDFLAAELDPEGWLREHGPALGSLARRAGVVSVAASYAFGTTPRRLLPLLEPLVEHLGGRVPESFLERLNAQDDDPRRCLRECFYDRGPLAFLAEWEARRVDPRALDAHTRRLHTVALARTGRTQQAVGELIGAALLGDEVARRLLRGSSPPPEVEC